MKQYGIMSFRKVRFFASAGKSLHGLNAATVSSTYPKFIDNNAVLRIILVRYDGQGEPLVLERFWTKTHMVTYLWPCWMGLMGVIDQNIWKAKGLRSQHIVH